jgi:hypothetical protein
MENYISEAIYELIGEIPGAFVYRGDRTYSNIDWNLDLVPNPPTEDEVNAKIEELIVEEPYKRLRIHRDILLKECDWVTLSDVQLSEEKRTAWLNYRQALRDLPNTANPTLDGPFITNVEWPQEP